LIQLSFDAPDLNGNIGDHPAKVFMIHGVLSGFPQDGIEETHGLKELSYYGLIPLR
jgi:hypothetical protein